MKSTCQTKIHDGHGKMEGAHIWERAVTLVCSRVHTFVRERIRVHVPTSVCALVHRYVLAYKCLCPRMAAGG